MYQLCCEQQKQTQRICDATKSLVEFLNVSKGIPDDAKVTWFDNYSTFKMKKTLRLIKKRKCSNAISREHFIKNAVINVENDKEKLFDF